VDVLTGNLFKILTRLLPQLDYAYDGNLIWAKLCLMSLQGIAHASTMSERAQVTFYILLSWNSLSVSDSYTSCVTSCLATHVYTSRSDLSLSPPVPFCLESEPSGHTTFNAKDNPDSAYRVTVLPKPSYSYPDSSFDSYSKRATYRRPLDIMEQHPCFCSCRTPTVCVSGDGQRYVGRFRHPQRWRSTAYCLGRSPSLFQDIRSRSFRIMRHLPSASSILYHY
jgi:hypothetical protein